MPRLPKGRLGRGLGSRTCGVGPNLSRIRLSRNRKKDKRKKLKSAQSSQARDPKRKETKGRLRRGVALEAGRVSQTRSQTRSTDDAWVFDAKVSDEEHLQKHRGFKGYCVRWQFIQRPKLYASYSLHEGRSRLARGESRGKWGLGCELCAEYSRCRLNSVYSSQAPRFAKFAKFQCRPKSAYACGWQIEQHIGIKSHLLATGKERKRLDGRAASGGFHHRLDRHAFCAIGRGLRATG